MQRRPREGLSYAANLMIIDRVAEALHGQLIEFNYYPSINDGPADMVRVENGPDNPTDLLFICYDVNNSDDVEFEERSFCFFNETKEIAGESNAYSEWFTGTDAEAAIEAARKIQWCPR
jgi:hypothetical protein